VANQRAHIHVADLSAAHSSSFLGRLPDNLMLGAQAAERKRILLAAARAICSNNSITIADM
jgi:hypothetical protein